MKLAYIGTYPPRECGIATFTMNLYNSMVINSSFSQSGIEPSNDSVEGFIVAMNNSEKTYNYPDEVKLTIRQEHRHDYLKAVKFINLNGTDLCILQHEFGIFGGESGAYILPLLHRLKVPLVVTLHTIQKSPSSIEKAVLVEICKMASKIVVMTHKAIEFLISIYKVPKKKIVLIEHGVPDICYDQEKTKKEFKLETKKIILTFGFIGRSKGIETVINALPKVIEKHPEVIYFVLGKTHPNVLRYSGEEYRGFLMRLVKNLRLEKHVVFLNEYISTKDLFKYLCASDIYITPYLNEAQITSGTLSYAVGVGSAVISTPYWHAEELLAEGRGKLFNFNDTEGLTAILTELLDDPEELKKLKRKAYDFGRNTTWPMSGGKYVSLAKSIINEKPTMVIKKKDTINPLNLPQISLAHINRLTDDTGIIQHAKFGIPNLKDGYCLDDNARALLMVLMAYKEMKDNRALELMPIYLSYIHYMQNADGTFRNFMNFSRNFLDELGSEDSFGRAIWALGYLLGNAPNDAFYQAGREVFFKAVPNFKKLKSIRSIANTIIGISHYLKNNTDDSITEILNNLTYKLVKHYEENETPDWKWFEALLAYDNGMLPLALLHSAEILNDIKITKIALESMKFLTTHTFKDNYLSVIGNEKWYKKDEERSVYAQQPIDAMAMVLMYQQAFVVTRDREYLNMLFRSFLWFLGENDLRMKLYDFETKGCCDGFVSYGVNRNQGAESTLAYLISRLTVQSVDREFQNENGTKETIVAEKNKKIEEAIKQN